MTLFWTLLTLLTLAAIAFLLVPLLRQTTSTRANQQELNVEITKKHLIDLQRDLDNAVINESEYKQAKIDLERALLQSLGTNASQQHSANKQLLIPLLVALALPGAAAYLYLKTGAPQLATYDPASALQQQAQQTQQQQTAPDVQQMVTSLAARLQQHPDDAKGWAMLGRSLKVLKRYDEASKAYSQVLRIDPGSTDAMIGVADSTAMMQGGSLKGRPYEMITRALDIEPNKIEARWLAGIAESEMGNYQKAIDYWQPLKEELANSQPKLAAQLDEQINTAKSLLNGNGAIAAQSSQESNAETPDQQAASEQSIDEKLTVHVTLADAFSGQVKDNDFVFIYAKAMQGPPMPLAAKKIQVKDLPLTVTLDDSSAMMPQMKLSLFDQVIVGARVSKTGQPIPSAGDLSGELKNIQPGQQETINIVIDQVVQ